MLHDYLSSANISNQPTPSVGSHSHTRTISTIPKHHKNINFMPTFLIESFQRRKQHRKRRSLSFSSMIRIDNNDEKSRGNNPLMKLISNPTVSAFLRRNKKSSDHEQCKDRRTSLGRVKCLPSSFTGFFQDKKQGLKSVEGKAGKEATCGEKTSEDSKPRKGKTVNFSLKGKTMCRMRSVSTISGSVEIKNGMKIKGLARMKSREKGEKRFELCKKKILMGEKCRPLNGNLRYDKHGVLIPEELV